MPSATVPRRRRWSGVAARRVSLIVVSTVVALGAVNACGSSTTQQGPATGAAAASATGSSTGAPVMIHIQGFRFTVPASVPPGSQVEVMNMDNEAHTVTADAGGGFDVQAPAGQIVTFAAPSKAGRYPFHCDYHSNMHGVLIVR